MFGWVTLKPVMKVIHNFSQVTKVFKLGGKKLGESKGTSPAGLSPGRRFSE
ncbi:similar to An12g01370 [Aspergillus luchuensis]|uniref:Similar to An12g01370 n=1 Tax=Aspergillus kawachii TaxID=1069201 RepID=A0A146FGD0_ASPKA|nr:similar to An12g01370 [Aspergillus luchuensis]